MQRTMPARYISDALGTKMWVVAKRLTPALRAKGYTLAVSTQTYDALQRRYETETFGAPLKRLEAAAPDMLAALDQASFELGQLQLDRDHLSPDALHRLVKSIDGARAKATGTTP